MDIDVNMPMGDDQGAISCTRVGSSRRVESQPQPQPQPQWSGGHEPEGARWRVSRSRERNGVVPWRWYVSLRTPAYSATVAIVLSSGASVAIEEADPFDVVMALM